ncbi:MAG: hypothetical protein HC802_09200 [Caldilineaceae bacterium]|nr:hypothetical protein [Caldilineaceae bacterium]
MKNRRPIFPFPKRALLLLLALLSLFAAMWAGLIRLGWGWPAIQPTLPMAHGVLMVSGFLGTLISLERAVAPGFALALCCTTAHGRGRDAPDGWGSGLARRASDHARQRLLVIIMVRILRIHITLYTTVIVAGSLCWLMGNLLWLAGSPVPQVVTWWIGFPLLTVAGERLELGRFLRLSARVTTAFVVCVIVFLAGALLSTIEYALGVRLAGVGLVLLAVWLLRYDIASRRIKAGGQARYIALCLLSGYVWLVVGGLLMVLYGGVSAGPIYDAMLHSIFLGFVFAMIFAHAPIVFPAVLERSFHYSPRLYSQLILLQITLVLRMAGDLLLWPPGRLWGGLLNVLVLLLFLGNTLASIRK